MKRLGVFSIVLSLGALMVCSLAYADDNTIYGCYKKNDGQLRIVKQGSHCLPSEAPISWNKEGASGPPGAPGSAGLPGPPGPPGTRGLDGISVESASLPENDLHCPNGGSQFTSASGVTYACNGEGTEGGTIIFRTIGTGPCSDGYGLCPNPFSYYGSSFRIRDTAVNDSSVITINLLNPQPYTGCEVTSVGTGEFSIACIGGYQVANGAILNYAVFNPFPWPDAK
ncbi:MAG TPA: hypothetical protein VLK23_21745 [Thermodesulfobacteriota bacterium]|nr:hypothetical protein [Thermodesulfobacteriota bacterium]